MVVISNKNYNIAEETEDTATKLIKDSTFNQANEIYFYSDIYQDTAFLLNKAIRDLEKTLRIVQINLDLPKPPRIKLYINSGGGSAYDAFSCVDIIKSCKIPVDTYVEGSVCSAATLLSMSGNKRYITKNSVMLLHQISAGFQGTYENHMDERKNIDAIMKRVKDFYVSHSNIQLEELEELLKHDIDLSAEECIKYKFADYII